LMFAIQILFGAISCCEDFSASALAFKCNWFLVTHGCQIKGF
jgi:hypothetical protein